MAKWTLPDMLTRAEADRQTQEAVAAALMQAAEIARAAPDGEVSYDDILALAPDTRKG